MKIEISPDFTIDDIHKIREINYENTKNMSQEQLVEYYAHRGENAKREIESFRQTRKIA